MALRRPGALGQPWTGAGVQAAWRARVPARGGALALREICERHGITVRIPAIPGLPRRPGEPGNAPLVLVARGDPALLQATLVTRGAACGGPPLTAARLPGLAAAVAGAGRAWSSSQRDGHGHRLLVPRGALDAGGPPWRRWVGRRRTEPRPMSSRALYEWIIDSRVGDQRDRRARAPEWGRLHGRNRLMAAMAGVTVVVEAPMKSGARSPPKGPWSWIAV